MKKLLITATVATIAFSANAQNVVDVDSDEFGAAVRSYLLENPEVIFEAVDIYNAKQEQLATDAAQGALSEVMPTLLDETTGFVIGNPDAKITLVEFIDYNCGYCRKAHEAVNAIIEKHSDVKVIIRHFPILSQGSLEASQVAMAINTQFGQEKAIAFHNAAYDAGVKLDKASALKIAENIGIDIAKIEYAFTDATILGQISTMNGIAAKLKIEGTPGFIIGDQIIRGYVPEDQLEIIIDSIRDK